jgi:TM2 domain-containing membrane protein YozV
MRGETAEPVSIRDALAAAEVSRREKRKNPAIAAGLSLLFNGLGQAYNGQFTRGVLVLLASLLGLFLMIVPGVAVWLWGGYDAYRTAKGMNEGLVPYRETSAPMIIAFLVVWAVVIFSLSAAATMLLVAMGLQGMV